MQKHTIDERRLTQVKQPQPLITNSHTLAKTLILLMY